MTALTHIDPDFSTVFAIEAINEPIQDATKTPGYGDCELQQPLGVNELCRVCDGS
jgi:hypothetical protein